ncbi:MAG: hypothetical protein NC930_05405, partial [Candidatus Omnitrophica bacterium]|nr:hypothetical protein [Candidatus Omnitrophota bacterium]
MKIAIVAPEVFPVPPIRGGAIETLVHEMALFLSNLEIHIFGISDPDLPLGEKRGHITYWRYRKNILHHILLSTYKLPFKQSTSNWYYWPYSRWIASKL